jgi:hypothetical protein
MAVRESTHVTFTIESPKMTAAQIEQAVGLKPDASWLAGAARGAFGAIAKNHGFVLESTVSPNLSVEQHVKDMIKRLSPYAQKLGALGPELDIEFVISLHRKVGPVVDLGRDDLRWLGVIGARIRIDIQIVTDAPKAGGAAPAKPETRPTGYGQYQG